MSDAKTPLPTTTDAGIPAPSDEHSLSVGPNGPLLMQDHCVLQKMAQFNRERVPERVVHAKGSGAHGLFVITEDARSSRAPISSTASASRPDLGAAVAGKLDRPAPAPAGATA
jgi:catalase